MKKSNTKKGLQFLKKDWQLYSLLILPVLYYAIFKYGPMIGNIIAFRKYVPGGPWLGTTWVGLKYFKMFILDPQFWEKFRNTIVIGLSSLVFGHSATGPATALCCRLQRSPTRAGALRGASAFFF